MAHSGQTLAYSDSFNPDSAKILNDGMCTSNGGMTSILYTNKNGVASVKVRTEVW